MTTLEELWAFLGIIVLDGKKSDCVNGLLLGLVDMLFWIFEQT